ncbi:MAG: NUDIX hydrolase [Actinomycetota bacterium]
MSTSGFRIEGAEVVHEGAVVTTEIVSLRTPEGGLVDRQVVRHPGAVAVVAVHGGMVVLVRQYRVALDTELVEIPAGKLDIAGEAPAEAARRELIEEVGLDPQNLVELGSFATAAGFCDEELTIFAATECTEVAREVDGIEEAHSQILRVPADEALATAAAGGYPDAKTVIGLFWAHQRGLLG